MEGEGGVVCCPTSTFESGKIYLWGGRPLSFASFPFGERWDVQFLSSGNCDVYIDTMLGLDSLVFSAIRVPRVEASIMNDGRGPSFFHASLGIKNDVNLRLRRVIMRRDD